MDLSRPGRWAALAAVLVVTACTTDNPLGIEPQPAPAGTGGTLATVERLAPDTAEAALYDGTATGTPWVGVWAAEAAGCPLIDQQAYTTFAVVTVRTMRRSGQSCSIAAPVTAGGPFQALCQAGGATAPREFTFVNVGPDRLTITEPANNASASYVRCRLP